MRALVALARPGGPARAAPRRAPGARRRPWPASRSGSSTLRRAVSQGSSAGSWNMNDGRAVPRTTSPVVGPSSPATRLSSVDLPHPEAPSRQTNSPGPTRRSMLRSAVTASGPVPKVLPTPRRSSAIADGPLAVRLGPLDDRGHTWVTPVPCRVRRRPPSACPTACRTALSAVTSTNPARFGSVSAAPAVTLSLASWGNVAASGSMLERQLGEGAVQHGRSQRRVGELLDRVVRHGLGLRLVGRGEVDRPAAAPRSSASTVCGCSCRNCVRTISTVVGNLPSGHRVRSSTRTFAPASTSRELHGSGSQPPATSRT